MVADDLERGRPRWIWPVVARGGKGETCQASEHNENVSSNATMVATNEVLLFKEMHKGPSIAETKSPSFDSTFPGQCSLTQALTHLPINVAYC